MGLFDILFGSSDSNSKPDSEENGSSREVWIEGRESNHHTHSDGTTGTDTYAARVSYVDGVNVHETNAGYGHISNGSSTPDHVK